MSSATRNPQADPVSRSVSVPGTGPRAFTVAQVAERFAVKQHVILALIKAGELEAKNLHSPTARRPRWRIMPEALAAFERMCSSAPEPATPPRRKKKTGTGMIDPETGKVRREFRKVGSVKERKGSE